MILVCKGNHPCECHDSSTEKINPKKKWAQTPRSSGHACQVLEVFRWHRGPVEMSNHTPLRGFGLFWASTGCQWSAGVECPLWTLLGAFGETGKEEKIDGGF